MTTVKGALINACSQALATYDSRHDVDAAHHPFCEDEYAYVTPIGAAVVKVESDALKNVAHFTVIINGTTFISFTRSRGDGMFQVHAPAALEHRALLVALIHAAAHGSITYRLPVVEDEAA